MDIPPKFSHCLHMHRLSLARRHPTLEIIQSIFRNQRSISALLSLDCLCLFSTMLCAFEAGRSFCGFEPCIAEFSRLHLRDLGVVFEIQFYRLPGVFLCPLAHCIIPHTESGKCCVSGFGVAYALRGTKCAPSSIGYAAHPQPKHLCFFTYCIIFHLHLATIQTK